MRSLACAIPGFLLVSVLPTIVACHKNQGAATEASAKNGPVQKWAFATGSRMLRGSALGSDGTIYSAGADGLYAVSSDGKLLWKYDRPRGLAAPPAIGADGLIYVASSWGGFVSLNPDGSLRWDSRRGMIGFDSSPTIGTGTVYLANIVSDLWAFEPGRSNPLVWQVQTERDGTTFSPSLPGTAAVNHRHSTASPVIGPLDAIYVPRQNWLHTISSDGTPGWQLTLTNATLGPAAISQTGVIFVGDIGGSFPRLYAVEPNGSLRWRLELPSQIVGSPVVDAHGNIYFSTTTHVVGVSPDGSLAWKYEVHDRCASSPALTEDGTLYLGVDPNQLIALDTSGKLKWSLKMRGTVGWPPVISPDGTLYVTNDAGEILALEDSGSPLMQNAWPRYQHDSQNTGRIPGL